MRLQSTFTCFFPSKIALIISGSRKKSPRNSSPGSLNRITHKPGETLPTKRTPPAARPESDAFSDSGNPTPTELQLQDQGAKRMVEDGLQTHHIVRSSGRQTHT